MSIVSLIFPFLLLSAPALVHATCQKYLTAAQSAASTLQASYFSNGVYSGDQAVWISAVDTFYLLQLDAITGNSTYSAVIDTVFNGQETYLTTGQSFDDVQWVVLAYMFAGNAHLDSAKMYYDIASTAVDSSYCGGGLFWNGEKQYKNAITNELYLATSGFLYDSTQNETYLNNLKTTWTWLKASKMVASNGLFDDGLTNDGKCASTGTQWTYNQGVVLAGLAYLYKFTKDEQYLTEAYNIVDATISNLTVDGGLRESCETNTDNQCNADQETFKGIDMFFMAWFLKIGGKDNGSTISDFIKAQADKVMANALVSGTNSTYGSVWYASGSSDSAGSASAQASALGALVAAAQQSC
ncbi:glycoside hydrolase family 76 protein [Mycena latifolia]|nr:glycoside hydrolase family 76 protein [Mycena latifolia]